MSDRITAWIRTVVPVGVGAAATWGAKRLGVQLDSAGLTASAVTAATGVYYFAVSSLERKWPAFGVLLGSKGAPTYSKPTVFNGAPALAVGSATEPPRSIADLFPPGTTITVPPATSGSWTLEIGPDGPRISPSTIGAASDPVEASPADVAFAAGTPIPDPAPAAQ